MYFLFTPSFIRFQATLLQLVRLCVDRVALTYKLLFFFRRLVLILARQLCVSVAKPEHSAALKEKKQFDRTQQLTGCVRFIWVRRE